MLLPRLISVHVVSVFVLILVPFFSNNTSADSFPGGVSHKASVGASGLTQYRASLDSFNPVAADGDTTGTFRVVLEEPVSGEIHGGIGNLRGWAIASDGIEKVEIWTDGVYSFDVPYGGARGDVLLRAPAGAEDPTVWPGHTQPCTMGTCSNRPTKG